MKAELHFDLPDGKEVAMEKVKTYTLPYPPSVNDYWKRNRNGGVRIGARGVAFRKEVAHRLNGIKTLYGRLAVIISLHAPTKRKMDLDNCLKATLDACEHASMYENDSQIDHVSVTRGVNRKYDPCLILAIGEIE